jgi:hypothetical protein
MQHTQQQRVAATVLTQLYSVAAAARFEFRNDT